MKRPTIYLIFTLSFLSCEQKDSDFNSGNTTATEKESSDEDIDEPIAVGGSSQKAEMSVPLNAKESKETISFKKNITEDEDEINDTNALDITLAEMMAHDLEAFISQAGYSSEQSEIVKAGSLATFSLNNPSIDPNNIEIVAPAIIGGAIRTLNNKKAPFNKKNDRATLSETITKSVFQSISQKYAIPHIFGLNKKSKDQLAGKIASSAIASLTEGGLPKNNFQNSIGKIINISISHLQSSGLIPNQPTTSESLPALQHIASLGMKALKNAGIDYYWKTVGNISGSFSGQAIQAMFKSRIINENSNQLITPFITTVTKELNKHIVPGLGKKYALYQSLSDSTSEIEDISDPNLYASLIQYLVIGSIQGSFEPDDKPERIAIYLADISSGLMKTIKTDAKKIDDVSPFQKNISLISKEIMNHMIEIKSPTQNFLPNASKNIAKGISIGLGYLITNRNFPISDLGQTISHFIQEVLPILIRHFSAIEDKKIDLFSYIRPFSTGIIHGLSHHLSTWEISKLKRFIISGYQEAFISTQFSGNIKNIKTRLRSHLIATILELSLYCHNNLGLWSIDHQKCHLSTIYPPANFEHSLPSLQQETDCLLAGGFIKYFRDASGWACHTIPELSYQKEELCTSAKFWWVSGANNHTYCKTEKPRSTCYKNSTKMGCLDNKGCDWQANYCINMRYTTCSPFIASSSCLNFKSCQWHSNVNICENKNRVGEVLSEIIPPTAVLNSKPDPVTSTPTVNITVSGTGVLFYKYKIGLLPDHCTDQDYSESWISVDHKIKTELPDEGEYFICVIGRNAAGYHQDVTNASYHEWRYEKEHIIQTSPPKAILSGTPSNPTDDSHLNIKVRGDNLTHYQYKIVSKTEECSSKTGYSSWTDISKSIKDEITVEKDYLICVLGKNIIDEIQPIDKVTKYAFTKGTYWKLLVSVSSPKDLKIYYENSENLTIVWGDGVIEQTEDSKSYIKHEYQPGDYTLKIKGRASSIRFGNKGDYCDPLTGIQSKISGLHGLKSFEKAFYRCHNLSGPIPTDLFRNVKNITTFRESFKETNVTSIPLDLFKYHTNVTSFEKTFYKATSIKGTVPSLWETHPDANGSSCYKDVNASNSIPEDWK